MMSKNEQVRIALVDKGLTLTAKQISSRFGVVNPHDTIYSLRKNGLNIVLETTTARNGVSTNRYRYVAKKSRKS